MQFQCSHLLAIQQPTASGASFNMWKIKAIMLILQLLTESTLAGRLLLNPNLRKAVRLADEDNSFFISCLPHSSVGPAIDSRIRARELSWKRQLPPDRWVVMGTEPYERVHVEQSADGRGLDLVFRSIRPEDGGEYACQAVLDDKEELVNFELKVIEPIAFDATNEIQSVEEGADRFTLICNVSGNPKPQITWNVRGEVIRGGNAKYEVTSEGLVLYNISKADQGSYKCKATQIEDGITDFRDMVIDLRVQHMPVWAPGQRDKFYGFISGDSNLSCEADAEPPAKFTWLDKQNNEIAPDKISGDGSKSFLTLHVEHDDMFGDYSCIASNKMGTLRKVVSLSEGAKPGIPHIQIKKMSHESAELLIEENKSEMFLDIVGFRVEVKLKMEEWENATVTEFTKDESTTNIYTIRDLQPKTFYLIRAKARNLAGFSDTSNIIYLQTNDPHVVGQLLGTNSSVSVAVSVIAPSFLQLSLLVILRSHFEGHFGS